MAITRTTMVDDDGSGTTGTIINNAWKQELYGQIDAFGLGLISAGQAWTPRDGSVDALPMQAASGWFVLVGSFVVFWGHVIYPSTASSNGAFLGGLPFPNTAGMYAGAFLSHSPPMLMHLAINDSKFYLLDSTTSVQLPNSFLSGRQVIFQGFYLKA